MTQYAVYKGDKLLCSGTVEECAEKLFVDPRTIRHYATPTYKQRAANRKNGKKNYTYAVRLNEQPDAPTSDH